MYQKVKTSKFSVCSGYLSALGQIHCGAAQLASLHSQAPLVIIALNKNQVIDYSLHHYPLQTTLPPPSWRKAGEAMFCLVFSGIVIRRRDIVRMSQRLHFNYPLGGSIQTNHELVMVSYWVCRGLFQSANYRSLINKLVFFTWQHMHTPL